MIQIQQHKIFEKLLIALGVCLIAFFAVKTVLTLLEAREVGKPTPVEYTLAIEGVGEALAKPDIATVNFSVETRGDSLATVQTKNTETMNGLIEKIKALGIASEDIQTTNYNAYEDRRFDYEKNLLQSTEWVIYQTVEVKVRALDRVSDVVSTAGQNGATNISGPQFTVDKKTVYLVEARAEAIKDAQMRIEQIAESLGVKVDRVTSYSEWTEEGGQPYPLYADRGGVEASAQSPNIEAGTEKIKVHVSIVYLLKQ